MNRNFLVAAVLLVVFLLGVYAFRMSAGEKNPDQVTATEEVTPSTVQKTIVAVYEGKLPCADCEGIEAVLTLYSDETYTMSNTYLGKDVAPFMDTGKWTTLRGDATNPDAVVYQLYGEGKTDQNYLVNGDELQQLDENMQVITAPFNTSLTKKAAE